MLNSQDAIAEKWTPYVGGAVQPRMLMLETVEKLDGPDNKRVDGFGGFGQQLEAGLHINRFDLYLAYMRNLAHGEWYTYDYVDMLPGSESETHISIENWLDQRLLLGFRHYPKATQYRGIHFLFGGAVGF